MSNHQRSLSVAPRFYRLTRLYVRKWAKSSERFLFDENTFLIVIVLLCGGQRRFQCNRKARTRPLHAADQPTYLLMLLPEFTSKMCENNNSTYARKLEYRWRWTFRACSTTRHFVFCRVVIAAVRAEMIVCRERVCGCSAENHDRKWGCRLSRAHAHTHFAHSKLQ